MREEFSTQLPPMSYREDHTTKENPTKDEYVPKDDYPESAIENLGRDFHAQDIAEILKKHATAEEQSSRVAERERAQKYKDLINDLFTKHG